MVTRKKPLAEVVVVPFRRHEGRYEKLVSFRIVGEPADLAVTRGLVQKSYVQHFQNRGFIGWSACAILAQHEIINRACAIPAEDAIAHDLKMR